MKYILLRGKKIIFKTFHASFSASEVVIFIFSIE